MTRHLTRDELIDLAEGTRARGDAPHLGTCEACRRQLDALASVVAAVAEVHVPEPSPLFWNHLSARVREAVHAEAAPPRRPLLGGLRDRVLGGRLAYALTGGAVLALLVATALTMRGGAPVAPAGSAAPAALEQAQSESLSEDPSLVLVADLTSDMDWETARDAGLATDESAEHAVTQLSEDELRQLQRLLQSELGRLGA